MFRNLICNWDSSQSLDHLGSFADCNVLTRLKQYLFIVCELLERLEKISGIKGDGVHLIRRNSKYS